MDKSHSREMGGTGLGLSIVRGAVIMHRGSVKVYSSEGEGTTFTGTDSSDLCGGLKEAEKAVDKRKRILQIFCIVFFIVLLSGCNKRTDVKEGDPFIYCLNEDRTGLSKSHTSRKRRKRKNAPKKCLKN